MVAGSRSWSFWFTAKGSGSKLFHRLAPSELGGVAMVWGKGDGSVWRSLERKGVDLVAHGVLRSGNGRLGLGSMLVEELEGRWSRAKMEEKIVKGDREREAANSGGRSCGLAVKRERKRLSGELTELWWLNRQAKVDQWGWVVTGRKVRLKEIMIPRRKKK
ncbi:hypothetical protein KY284_012943 [Solanum tuberosum]|nr:hypothetical protein KY284_012943 [Solanum tuberosum]